MEERSDLRKDGSVTRDGSLNKSMELLRIREIMLNGVSQSVFSFCATPLDYGGTIYHPPQRENDSVMLLIYQGQQSGSPGHPRLAVLVVLGYGLCVVLDLRAQLGEPVILILALDSGWSPVHCSFCYGRNSNSYRVSAMP